MRRWMTLITLIAMFGTAYADSPLKKWDGKQAWETVNGVKGIWNEKILKTMLERFVPKRYATLAKSEYTLGNEVDYSPPFLIVYGVKPHASIFEKYMAIYDENNGRFWFMIDASADKDTPAALECFSSESDLTGLPSTVARSFIENMIDNKQGFRLAQISCIQNQKSKSASNPGIPKQFQGAWDAMEGKVDRCKYGSESDSRFTVKSTEIRYYEAVCKLKKVVASNSDNFSGDFDCEGEGNKWKTIIQLKLDNGRLIHKGSGPRISRNTRCK